MIYPSLDELIDKVDSRYTLVVQVAKKNALLQEDGCRFGGKDEQEETNHPEAD